MGLPELIADACIKEFGYTVDPVLLYDIIKQSVRKLELIGKDDEYLPVLVPNELNDFYMREKINRIGG